MLELKVNDFSQLLDAMLKISDNFGGSKPWWRGQCALRDDWKLVPSVYRPNVNTSEQNLTFRFKHMAKVRHLHCPVDSDYPGWLFLMQHYRLLTRLLDWSESPLVATFNAIEDTSHDLEDGALLGLWPAQLNRLQGEQGKIFAADHSGVHELFRGAYDSATAPSEKVVAVATNQMDLRHLVQQSQFTIHATKTPLEELPIVDKCLARIRIPAVVKQKIREIVDLLGISRATLYPDLENLASYLRTSRFAPLQ